MALSKMPGVSGLTYARIASDSLSDRALGKFSDLNLVDTLSRKSPTQYDKKILSLYTQTTLYSNDFLNMIDKSTPFYTDDGSFYWDLEVPYSDNKIVAVPQSTLSQPNIGIDGKEFEIVLKYKVAMNDVLSLGSRKNGPQIHVTKDPTPAGRGYLVKASLLSTNAASTALDPMWLSEGVPVTKIHNLVGEFTQDLSGLPHLGQKIRMYDHIGAGYGDQHTVTGWADDIRSLDDQGNPRDLLVYFNKGVNQYPTAKSALLWEPFIEFQLRKELLDMRKNRFIWAKPGQARDAGGKGDLKQSIAGVYYQMKEHGNYHAYNKGELSATMFRNIFGDLFYRRVDVSARHVKLYTNEAGFEEFDRAMKQDALGSAINITTNVDALKSTNITMTDPSQHLVYSFAFDKMISRQTGLVELVHLQELDLPENEIEAGSNKKSSPIYLVFDVSETSNGSLSNNIREVRLKRRPGISWGYVDGRISHLGRMATKNHSASHMGDNYTIYFEDRSSVFIEDLSKVVLIEEADEYFV